jgi:chemotaxis protein MotC
MKARRLVDAIFFLALAAGASAPASAQTPSTPAVAVPAPMSAQTISAMAADLQALQARIAAGDKSAYAAQADRLNAIGAAIAAAKPEVWKSKRETNAVVVFLLSGGQPREVVQLLQSGVLPESEIPFIRGAIAYIAGNEVEAVSLLGGVDPRKLDLRLAGQVAFAQSVLQTSRDAKNAVALLDLARLLAPGCLVEEAALRREILLVADQRDIDRVASLSRQYATRFGRSVYADDFLHGLASALVQAGLTETLSSFDKLRVFLAWLAPDVRRDFLLTIARAEALNGKFAVAGAASAEMLRDTPGDSADEARGRLYEAAARILTPEYDDGVTELQSVAQSKLDKGDQALLAAVRGVAAYLRQPPGEMDSQSEQALPDPPTPQGGTDEAAATIALAEEAISRTAVLAGVAEKGKP